MTFRYDPDDVIATWAAESIGGGGPDYLPEVLLMVERTPQHRWARWVPGAGTMSPAKAPSMSTRTILVVAAALLLLVVVSALAAGALRRPAFALQAVVPIPGSVGVVFASATDDAIWATVDGGVVSIDPKTGAATRFEVPGGGPELNGVAASSDAVWVADYQQDRVVRLDRASGKVTAEIPIQLPLDLHVQDGVWAIEKKLGGPHIGDIVRIDPATATIDLRIPGVSSYAVVPGALWYVTRSAYNQTAAEAFAVEVDPVTGVERRRIAIPVAAARAIAIDAGGNPWVYQRRSDQTTFVALDAANGTAGAPFMVPFDVLSGVVPIGSSMWAVSAADGPNGARMVELGPTGPTGRAESLDPEINPDGAVVAFGSVWIPSEGDASLYRYPADALAP